MHADEPPTGLSFVAAGNAGTKLMTPLTSSACIGVHRRFQSLLLVLATLVTSLAMAQQDPRPKVGLVLGGGGARGGAHLGVIEVLEEMRVPVDCIAGTSMGALVGGAYAAGVAPTDITELVSRTDWIGIFDDTAGRGSLDLRRKQLDDRFYGIEFGVS